MLKADGKVTFKWRDYRDGSKNKLMTLNAFEFIRRFLLHILPKRYFKIRYYGLLAQAGIECFLNSCLEQCLSEHFFLLRLGLAHFFFIDTKRYYP